jgi:hypothetical protein
MNDDSVNFKLLPEIFLPTHIKNTKDIYEYRSILKQLLLQEYVINYLLDIIIKAVEENLRFKTLDCLKVIKAILKNNFFEVTLSDSTVNKLFQLYQVFIFHKNEEVKSVANLLIRFQFLNSESIKWLILNYEKSEHSLNRLLRYPKKDPLITEWAKNLYEEGKLKNRSSELIAILIHKCIPEFIVENGDTVIWAIYYSTISDETKQKLLIERFSVANLETLWEISIRLKYFDVIEFMRKKTFEQLQNNN